MADGSSNDASQQNEDIHHISIEITPASVPNDTLLAKSIGETLQNASPSHFRGESCCILKLDKDFRGINKRAYTPEKISIGPFHRGKESLKEMDNHKLLYVNALLSRTTKLGTQTTLVECVESLKLVEEEARKCYSEEIHLNSNEFVEMMLYDGLFIIELLRKNAGEVKIEVNDPFFGNNCTLMTTLTHDLLLLENQLPMLVLNCLFNLPALKEELWNSCSITILALQFFNRLVPRDKEFLEKYSDFGGKHLLDLLGNTFRVLPRRVITNNKSIPSVTELINTGVKFKSVSKDGNFLDIKFKNDVLEFPIVTINDQTHSLLGNLIAFEQYCDGNHNYVTSYVFIMNCLIGSGSDVAILRNKGIIRNRLGNDNAVLSLFNSLSSDKVDLSNFYYSQLCDQVDTYCKSPWHVWGQTLKRHFTKPWVFFALALASAIFGGLSYFINKS